MSTMAPNEECSPIKSISELQDVLLDIPNWASKTIKLEPRSTCKVDNQVLHCHHLENTDFHVPRIVSAFVPRTLVCHDYKNGYLLDRFIDGDQMGVSYTFYRWNLIDIFVYFSHHFITVPPLCWINKAHENGVKILGTVITEWDEGVKLCEEFLANTSAMLQFVDGLVQLLIAFNLDGWLINVENPVAFPERLVDFLHELTKKAHEKKPGSLILWYDSVLKDGQLKWQNELNLENQCFFYVCDGIFLNYNWKDDNLKRSALMAKHRQQDVFVGIDVFGRKTFYKEGFDCYKAAQLIRQSKLSIAIFAPGWTHESLEDQKNLAKFKENDNTFWNCLWPYLYTSPIDKPFHTTFHIGAVENNFHLDRQQVQLSLIPFSQDHLNASELKDRCKCLQLLATVNNQACSIEKNDENLMYHHLFSLDIKVDGPIYLYTFTKVLITEQFLDIYLIVKENERTKLIVCSSLYRQPKNTNSKTIINASIVNTDESCGSFDVRPENSTLRGFKIDFKSPVVLVDIFGAIPRGKSVVLTGFGLKAL